MLYRRFLIILLTGLVAIVAVAQQEPVFNKQLVPDRKVHDFGTINEKDGPVTHVFKLKNTGVKTAVVNGVTAWCGCTTVDFSKKPILAGQTGTVAVTFDPSYRSGKFSKEVVVLTDDGRRYLRLWVKGMVVPMRHPVTDDHPYHYGQGLYMSHRVLPFRALKKGGRQVFQLRVANDTDQSMTIVFRREPDNRVLQMPDSLVLKPYERRKIDVGYTAIKEYACRRYIDITPIVNGKAVDKLRVTWLPEKKAEKVWRIN